MTPVELAVVTVVVCWAVRRLLVDASFAVRGRTPPTLAARQARAQQKQARAQQKAAQPARYGVKGYVKDLWSDAWSDARVRREAKRAARPAPGATRGRGEPGDGSAGRAGGRADRPGWRERLSARWGQARERMSARWGQAWDRLADRWERRQSGSDRERGRTGEPDTSTSRRPGTGAGDGDQEPATGPRAGGTGGQQQRRQDTAGRQVVDARRVGGRWVADLTGGGADQQQTDRANGARPRTNNHGGDQGMSEATGLASAIAYANQMRQANESGVTNAEGYTASLQAGGVSGPAVQAVAQAMEAQQAAAAAWAQAENTLNSHQQVGEAYNANKGAGSREFVTSE